MKTILTVAGTLSMILLVSFPQGLAYAAASVTLQNVPANTSILAKTNINFNVMPAGFSYPLYHLTDSFSNSSASVNNIEGGGKFSWTPSSSDAGTHVLAFSVTDNEGNYATVSQTIIVLPPPSVKINSVSPGATVMAGSKLIFAAVPTGFTNPLFVVGDTTSNPSITNANIDQSGNFSWTPTLSDNGDHSITVYVSDSLGHSASANLAVRVGAGPTLILSNPIPGTSVNPGQGVSFYASATNFSPTGYSLRDTFSGQSLISNSNITTSGQFSWTPQNAEVGTHVLTVTGVVGAFGASASSTVTIVVFGPGGIPLPSTTIPSAANGTSTLSLLQAQLAQLQASIAAQVQGAAMPTSMGLTFTLYLHSGSNGEEVLELQKVLSKEGFMTVAPNGNFGPSTLAAVKKFQAAHGLAQLGIVGPGTRSALNALSGAPSLTPSTAASANSYVFEHFMGIGDDDPDVAELQKKLIQLGYLSGNVTGYYGAATEKAVKKYQTVQSLPATGYVASDTRAALNR